MNSFNEFYYSFSPQVADLERENPWVKETIKISITPLLLSLSLLNYVEMSSEFEVIGYSDAKKLKYRIKEVNWAPPDEELTFRTEYGMMFFYI